MAAVNTKSKVRLVDDPGEIEEELGRSVDQNENLRSALVDAKETISLQDETIRALSEDRYALATVLSFQEMRWREPKVDELDTGCIVKDPDGSNRPAKVVGFEERTGKYKIEHLETGKIELCYGNSSVAPTEGSELLLWRPSVARVAYENKILEIPVRPPYVYKAGQTVRIQVDTFQICSAANEELVGEIARVVRRVDKQLCEVSANGSTSLVRTGVFEGDLLEEGDMVALDRTGQVILRKTGKSGDEFLFHDTTGVSWDDIGGLEDAKLELREAIELPHAHKAAFARLKMTPPKGIVLFGPPGCGKTLLGKAAATSLAQIYTGKADTSGFLYVKGPEILQRYVGDSEAKVRELFTNAAKFQARNGYPAIIFIDEAESILRKRGSGISSDVENTIVPMFLAMMDGLSESGAIVILTTNRPDMLDPAILRDRRVDRKILITRPSRDDTEAIFRIHLKGVPLSGGDIFSHAVAAANELFNPRYALYSIERKRGATERFCLSDLASGAMIAGVVNRAKSISFRRYLKEKSIDGVSEQDLKGAISDIYEENLRLKNSEALDDFVADYKDEIVSIRKTKFAR